MRFEHQGLNADERCANTTLMAAKQRLRDQIPFLPAQPFIVAKAAIEREPMFRTLSAMPKGAVLHLHWDSAVPAGWVLQRCTDTERCYMSTEGALRIFPADGAGPGPEWAPVAVLRARWVGTGRRRAPPPLC